jgi:uncharacterized RDD family membrane protein YckC
MKKILKEMNKVSKLKRLVNFMIDSVTIGLLSFLVFYIMSYIFLKFKLSSRFGEGKLISIDVFLLIIAFMYYFISESMFGRTVGKYITSTKVVNSKGNIPSVISIFLRTIIRLIPLDSITYLFDSVVWHDKYSLTYLVSNKE